MNLNDDLSLQIDIFEEDGQTKVFIAEENSTGSTSTVETKEDILSAIRNYLEDYCNL